jgi:S-adenosyl methyltransferase
VLHFLTDADDPAGVVRVFRDAVAPGSFLVVSHTTPGHPLAHARMGAAVAEYTTQVGPFTPRTPAQIEDLLTGWELVPPGLVAVDTWPDSSSRQDDFSNRQEEDVIPMVAGLARWTRLW